MKSDCAYSDIYSLKRGFDPYDIEKSLGAVLGPVAGSASGCSNKFSAKRIENFVYKTTSMWVFIPLFFYLSLQ